MEQDGTSGRRQYGLYAIGAAALLMSAAALAFALFGASLGIGHGPADARLGSATANAPPAPDGSSTGAAKPLQHMELEAQYAGPLRDTVIQRWRDPADGTICYVYLPVIVQHSPPTPMGPVQYGANGIGSISCVPAK